MMRLFRRRRNRNTLGDMASASIAKDDTPAGDPPMYRHHSSVNAQGFLKQCIVTLAGAFLAFVAVSRLNPWDSLRAIAGRVLSAMVEARTFWIFMMGVTVGSIVIPFLMAHLPHFFAESTQSSLQEWCHRGFENVPSSYQFVPVWAEHGVMRGTVFTAPASRWTDSETLHTPWPPPYQGKTAKFLKWSAFVEDGCLVMRQDGKNDVRASTEGLHCSVPMDARIPLAGAVMDLLPEAYKDKGPWIRKAPMKLVFPGARDPYAEEAVIFFADTAAEKEQWFLALSWAAKYDELCALDPENATTAAGLEAQRLYSRFSHHVRSVAPVMLPTALPPAAAALPATRASAADSPGAASSPGGDAGGIRRRTWWGGRRKPRAAGQAGGFAAPAAQLATGQRQKSAHSKSQVVGDFIKDKQWGSQPMKQGMKGTEGVPTRVKGALSVTKKRSTSAQNLVALAPAVAPIAQVVPHEPAAVLLTAASGAECISPRTKRPTHNSASASDLSTTALGPSMKAGLDHTASGTDILHCLETASTSGRLGGRGRASRHGSAGGLSNDDPGTTSPPMGLPDGVLPAAVDGGTLPPELFAGHGPAQLAGLHAVNMFLVRCAFDLLRSRRFHAVVQRRVQMRLSNITVPNFITPLQLGGLDLGNTLPLVKSAHALPSPSKVLMPRLVMHIVYQGTCKLTVKTSINMKESAAAMAMEKTAEDLDRGLDGGSSGTGTAPSPAGEAATDVGTSAELPGLEGMVPSEGGGSEGEGVDGAETGSGAGGAVADAQGKAGKGKRSGRLAMLGYRSIKNMMTGGVKRVMDSIAESVSGTNVTLEVSITELDGPVMVWMAPPPSNVMWLSFLEPPKLKVSAKPLNVNAMVHYTAMAVKLTAWLERKIKQALQKNMVFPACTDIKMSFLMDHSDLDTDNLLGLHIPAHHSTKSDNLDKSNKDETVKDGASDKHQDRCKSVADSFGASSVCAAVEQPSDSAPAAIPYPDDVVAAAHQAAIEQDELGSTRKMERAFSRSQSARNSTDHRPMPAEQPRPERLSLRQAHRAQPAASTGSKRQPPSGSKSASPAAEPSVSGAQAGSRRPFLRVFTQGIPRMLRRGPQPASPLHPDPLEQQEGPPAEQPPPVQPQAPATAVTPTSAEPAHAQSCPPPSTADSQAVEDPGIPGGGAQSPPAQPHPPAPAAELHVAAPLHVQPPPPHSALSRPKSGVELMELSPPIDMDPGVRAAGGSAPADMPKRRSDPCLSSAACELGLSDAEVPQGHSSAVSTVGVSPLPAADREQPSAEPPAHRRGPDKASVAAESEPVFDSSPVGDSGAAHASQPSGGAVSSVDPMASVLRQCSQNSHVSSQAAAGDLQQSGTTEGRPASAAQTDVSDADVSDGAAAISDAHNSNSAATPESSADEAAPAGAADVASPRAEPRSPWPVQSSGDGLASSSPAAESVASVTSVPTSLASGAGCDAGASGPGQSDPPQPRSGAMAMGESTRRVARRSGDGEGEDDTTTTCSDDVRSIMSTVGAPSDVDTPVGSSSGAARGSQAASSLPDMMHQDPTQAALLHLHMLGKSKSIKKGSYIISTDGAVVRAKKRLS